MGIFIPEHLKLEETGRYNEDGATIWRLLEPVKYYWNDVCLKVPAGFEFDGASIPQFAWSIIGPPNGKYLKAACIHDWMFDTHLIGFDTANNVFLDGMKDLGVGFLQRQIMYFAVQYKGKPLWDAKTPTKIYETRELIAYDPFDPWGEYGRVMFNLKEERPHPSNRPGPGRIPPIPRR